MVFRHLAADTPNLSSFAILQDADDSLEVQVGKAAELEFAVARVKYGLLGGDRECAKSVDDPSALAETLHGRRRRFLLKSCLLEPSCSIGGCGRGGEAHRQGGDSATESGAPSEALRRNSGVNASFPVRGDHICGSTARY